LPVAVRFLEFKIGKLLAVMALLWASTIQSQENYFTTVSVKKFIMESHKWQINIVGHWKKFHSNEGWNRFGIDLNTRRILNQWDLHGGVVSNNTIDKSEPDYWELRPWLGIGLTNTIYGPLQFKQGFRFEWRNLIFSESSNNKITTRYRYKLEPFCELKNQWQVHTSYEWYILPNKDLGTRFVNSGEWGLGVAKAYPKFTVSLNYIKEWYNKEFQPDASNGNTLALTVAF